MEDIQNKENKHKNIFKNIIRVIMKKINAKTVAMERNVSTVQFDDFLACRGITYFKPCHQITYQIEEDTNLVLGEQLKSPPPVT